MEVKKNSEANLENRKGFYFLNGLLLALAFVLVTFEWSKPAEQVAALDDYAIELEDEEMIPITEMTPPPPPPPPPQTTLIEIVEDDEEIEEELEIEDTESDEDEVIEFVDIPEEPVEDMTIFTVVEEPSSFPGGDAALMKFLGENTKYPNIAKDAGIQGKVYVKFVIEKDGTVNKDQIEVLRSVHPALDAEAIRVVKQMPKWNPGRQRGKPVRQYFMLPINFTLR